MVNEVVTIQKHEIASVVLGGLIKAEVREGAHKRQSQALDGWYLALIATKSRAFLSGLH